VLPTIDIRDKFTGPEVSIEAEAVEKFCAVVGNQGELQGREELGCDGPHGLRDRHRLAGESLDPLVVSQLIIIISCRQS
jgi:hypothetical protein